MEKQQRGERKVSGNIILMAGAGMIVLALVLFTVSLVYRKTAGKRIRDELKNEYE